MRVALVHYWLLGMRGGEKVLEAICRIFPSADIFCLFYDPDAVSPLLKSKNVRVSWLNPLRRFHRSLLPLMPMALEDLDLRGYDLVISSESGPAKGVLTSASTLHLCYCHSPMRYLWELYPFYRHDLKRSFLGNAFFSPLASYLRMWDLASAHRVDGFMANSRNVRGRIRKTYRRSARVVYPPTPVDQFRAGRDGDYSLIVSAMVADKRLDYAIRAFSRSGRKLKVVGEGPEFARLRQLAAPHIEFCGWVSDSEVRDLYSDCSALIVPGEEDFGMTMVEALASGKPVVAYGKGGSLEIVAPGCGVLYPEPTGEAIDLALRQFDETRPSFATSRLQARADKFSEAAFNARFLKALVHYGMPRYGMRRTSLDSLAPLLAPEHRARFRRYAAEDSQ